VTGPETAAQPHYAWCVCATGTSCLETYQRERERETRWLLEWEAAATAIRRPPAGERVADRGAFLALMSRHQLHPDLMERAQARLRGELVADPGRVEPRPQSAPPALF
jgi:hypothetical protein